MSKTRPPYSPEFRRQMVDLVRAGRDPEELAREFEPTSQSIRNWVRQAADFLKGAAPAVATIAAQIVGLIGKIHGLPT
jgi:transposase-like protein